MTAPGPDAAAPSPDLQDVLGQLPSGATINVHRWAETGGPKPGYRYLGRIDAADYSPELIARRWGGGHYRLYVRVPPDEARKAGVPQLMVRELAIDPAAAPAPPAAAPAPAPAADVPQGVAQLISLQAEMLRTAIAAMRPPESTAEMIRTVAELMRGQAQQDPLRDLMLELVRAQVTGGTRPQWAELWEVFNKGMEAAREWRATGDSSALERLGMRFAELLERTQSAAGGPSATAVPQRPAAPPLAPVAASALSSGTMAQLPAWRRWLDRLRPLVFEAARLSGPPEVYAQMLAEHLPPECDAEVGAMLAGDNWPDNLLAQLPADWAPVVGWLRRVLVAFGRQFEEPEEPKPEPESPGEGEDAA